MELWFKIYRETKGDRNSALVFDLTNEYELKVGNPLEESLRAINKITNTHPGPYTLLASGGVDSQAMIYAWKTSKTPFSIVHYSYGTNTEDTASLRDFCTQEKLPFDVRYFDVHHFINSSEYTDLAKLLDCASPHILTYVKIASLHPETCIMAGNYFNRTFTGTNWTINGLDRFRSQVKSNFVPFFFQSTPELAYSFLKTEINIQISRTEYRSFDPSIAISYEDKILTYKSCGFPIIKQSSKLTGFEEIKQFYDSHFIGRLDKLKWQHLPSKRPFDLIYRYGLFDHLPDGEYSDAVSLIHNNYVNSIMPN